MSRKEWPNFEEALADLGSYLEQRLAEAEEENRQSRLPQFKGLTWKQWKKLQDTAVLSVENPNDPKQREAAIRAAHAVTEYLWEGKGI